MYLSSTSTKVKNQFIVNYSRFNDLAKRKTTKQQKTKQ